MKVLTGTIKQTKKLNAELAESHSRSGKDGVSPTVSITDILDGTEIVGHRVSITDVNGTKSFDVMNGDNCDADLTAYRTAADQDVIDQNQNDSINAKYTKPATGIPKNDLNADVQTSLGKADTALQQHQDISGKVNVNQGIANAGKFLVVGSDGYITTVTMTAWQGGSY